MTTSPTASQSQVSTSSATHCMPNICMPTYVRSDVSDAARVSSSLCCDVIRVGGYHIANIYKPPTEHWNNTNLPRVARSPVFSGSSRISAPTSRLPDRSQNLPRI